MVHDDKSLIENLLADLECRFAHPPPHVEIQNGRVTACYDSIKVFLLIALSLLINLLGPVYS